MYKQLSTNQQKIRHALKINPPFLGVQYLWPSPCWLERLQRSRWLPLWQLTDISESYDNVILMANGQ